MSKRKICVVVASRANYGRIKYVMKAIKEDPEMELQLVVGASALLERFGKAINEIEKDGFKPDRKIFYAIEGETLATQAKSTGLGIIELATAFSDLKPDAIITVADRFETMATAIAASYLNIPLVHVQGGEVSGNIDDRVRHAITKLSDLHFPCTEQSRDRIIKMGEDPDFVFNCGCPAMDVLATNDLSINDTEMKSKYSGVGTDFSWEDPYLLVIQHPVTTSYGKGLEQIQETLNAVKEFKDHTKIVLWPNIDAGTDLVSKGMRVFRENHHDDNFRFFRNFSPEDFAKVIANAKVCIGNSSSFIREGAFLGVPAVIVGDRQDDRERGKNVKVVDYKQAEIHAAVKAQLEHGNYGKDPVFGEGDAGVRIAKILKTSQLANPKKVMY